MGKVHKSLRLDESLDERAQALKAEGESDATAYGRIIEAGLDALEGRDGQPAQDSDGEEVAAQGEAAQTGQAQSLQAVVDAQRAHIADLQTRLAKADEQLAAKDSHLEALEAITKAAQSLHAMNTKQITDGSEGRFRRAWRAFRKES